MVWEIPVHGYHVLLLWTNSRQIHSGGQYQSQTTHLMVMEQREVEELAGVLLFSLEMGSQWPKDHPSLGSGDQVVNTQAFGDTSYSIYHHLYSKSMVEALHLRPGKSKDIYLSLSTTSQPSSHLAKQLEARSRLEEA